MRLFLLVCLTGALVAWPLNAVAASPAPGPSPTPSLSPRLFWGLPTGNPAVAVGLSAAVNGLGQHYNGEPEKGNVMLASLLAFPLAWGVDSLTGGATMRVFAYALIAGVKGWSLWDAYQNAPSNAPSPARP